MVAGGSRAYDLDLTVSSSSYIVVSPDKIYNLLLPLADYLDTQKKRRKKGEGVKER